MRIASHHAPREAHSSTAETKISLPSLDLERPALPPAAHLPLDLPPPPRRPANRDVALMDDALRSLPPAAERTSQRQRSPSNSAVHVQHVHLFCQYSDLAAVSIICLSTSSTAATSSILHRTTTATCARSAASAEIVTRRNPHVLQGPILSGQPLIGWQALLVLQARLSIPRQRLPSSD